MTEEPEAGSETEAESGEGGSGTSGADDMGDTEGTGGTGDSGMDDSGTDDSGTDDSETDDSGTDTGEVECDEPTSWPDVDDGPRAVSVDAMGNLRGGSYPSVSGDGRFVVFVSNDLLDSDDDSGLDVYIYDQQCGTMSLLPYSDQSDVLEPVISSDGNTISFVVAEGFERNIYAYERDSGEVELVSAAMDGSPTTGLAQNGDISADGRYLVYHSDSPDLVPGDANGMPDVFVYDRQTEQTERISVALDGGDTNNQSIFARISADGRYVGFTSDASNIFDGVYMGHNVFVYDRDTGALEWIDQPMEGAQFPWSAVGEAVAMSDDGRFVAFRSISDEIVTGDTNDLADIFVRDRMLGTVELVSVDPDGLPFEYSSGFPSISGDGRHVYFIAGSYPGEPGMHGYVHDRDTGVTTQVDVSASGEEADAPTMFGDISADGQWVAFASSGGNLVVPDMANGEDIFVVPMP